MTSLTASLTEDERSRLGGLRDKQGQAGSPSHVFCNNAIHTDGQEYGLFPAIAMVNHSCVPNAGNTKLVCKDFTVIF